MPKIETIADLKKIKESASTRLSVRKEGTTRLIVGMGDSGLAAGARQVLLALMEETRKRSLTDVTIETMSGDNARGNEPVVDVVREGADRVSYGHVKPADAARIVADHIVGGKIVKELLVKKAG
jgi:NADP-reducing hydrogenase subunit HndB